MRLLYWEAMIESRRKRGKPIMGLAIIQAQDGGLNKIYNYGSSKKWSNSICILKVETIRLANRWEVEYERSQRRLRFKT